MDANTLTMIKTQVDVEDDQQIEDVYYKNNCNIVKTIMELSNLQKKEVHREYSRVDAAFDEVRAIVEEKEQIYHDLVNKVKAETQKDT